LEHPVCGDFQSAHETIFYIVEQFRRRPNIPMANGCEEILFHKRFILGVCFVILGMNSNDETFLLFRNAFNGGIEAERLPIGEGERSKELDECFRVLI
jgi:hypothetical protein